MSLSRRVARPLLAAVFIAEGLDAIRNPLPAEQIPGAVDPLSTNDAPPGSDTIPLVRVNGMVQVGGGVLLAIGKFPRLASLALIASIAPTTYTGHRFWEEPDADKRAQQRMQLLKNLGLLGGLIFSAVDTDGAPSVGWRTRRRVHEVSHTLAEVRTHADDHASSTAVKTVDAGRTAGRRAKRGARRAVRRAAPPAIGAARQAGEITTQAATAGVGIAVPAVRQAGHGVVEVAEEAFEAAAPYISAGLERAGEFVEEALDAAGPYLSAGLERAGDLVARVPHPSTTE
jgi:uncharacterized membrane protein YphA (DoxX/SURF4 family)